MQTLELNPPAPQGQTMEQHKARVRAITGPAKAEGRELTPAENRALLGCIGRDITGDLDDACAERLAFLLSTRAGAKEGTRGWIADAHRRPTARSRRDQMAVGCIVWAVIVHGTAPDDLDTALSKRWVTTGGAEIPPDWVVHLQRRVPRYFRLLNRLVTAGCLRRRDFDAPVLGRAA